VKNFRIQYLVNYRILLVLLVILVPVFSIVRASVNTMYGNAFFIREVVVILGALVLIGTYRSSLVRQHIQWIMLLLYTVIYCWQFTVLFRQDFSPNNLISFLIIATAVSVGFERKKLLLWFLSCSYVSIAAFVLAFSSNLAQAITFLMAVASIYIMTALINLRKFRVEKLVVESAREIRQKNKEIMESLSYAKRIQSALLPADHLVKKHLKDSFVLYRPKDIVAGDFYWLEAVNAAPSSPAGGGSTILFAAADCTGHGVPGAMVSVICSNGLNRAVREYGLTDPGKVLDKTREIVVQELNAGLRNSEKSEDDVKDGMDIALCVLDGSKLLYAGAHNPLWIIRKGADGQACREILEIKADKEPIGKYDAVSPYKTHSHDLESGDTIYIFSDGFVDQFGGPKGKKYKARAFRELLLSVQDEPMRSQQKLIEEAFEAWKGDLEQVDDVCVMGVRF
jgi:serine phosphatase RsbU (regulator of sigma subunit)